MSKYAPLRDHLLQLRTDRWHASFSEIEDILGFTLPNSAYKHQAWWANERHPKTHVQKKQWLQAGFGTDNLNLAKREVVFVRL